jgi:ATP-dependent RNA helicase DDX51/DBP6
LAAALSPGQPTREWLNLSTPSSTPVSWVHLRDNSADRTAISMAAPLYARYIPPKALKPTQTSPEEQSNQKQANSAASNKTKRHVKEVASNGVDQKPEKKLEKKPKKKRKAQEIDQHLEDHTVGPPLKKHETVFAKFNRSSRISERLKKDLELADKVAEKKDKEPSPEIHGMYSSRSRSRTSYSYNLDLKPLPQPEPVPEPEYIPTFSSLPPWLKDPIIVGPQDRSNFEKFGLSEALFGNLSKHNYTESFPVQTRLLRMLLPGPQLYIGDVCVSAPTGSGKTLGYLIPIVEELKHSLDSKLRAIIVVPTRELVSQAYHVANMIATGTNVQVGTAVGNVARLQEQDLLIEQDQIYNPEEASKLYEEAKRRFQTGFLEDDSLFEDIGSLLPGHVRSYRSKVDILICTPGRLVEHIRSTPGFSLAYIKYLVIDEADKLLDDGFQEWVDVIHDSITESAVTNPVTKFLSQTPNLGRQNPLKKVILSATMTRDISKLAALKLRRPALVVVASVNHANSTSASAEQGQNIETIGDIIELPRNLKEMAVPVGDGAEKPLYLSQLLHSLLHEDNPQQVSSRILVFVRTTEDTMRLKHMLLSLRPEFAAIIESLTKVSSKAGRKVLSSLQSGKVKVVIATDRASRGLDVVDLTDVISYDVPRSVTDYVHRVGRTARAERSGTSWTFFTDSEGRWFWTTIARSDQIRRSQGKVERRRIAVEADDDTRVRYEQALQALKTAVLTDKH